ncbi:MAG: DUF4920 domain-containing protein [Flavobacterium sp. BFFFF2]|nr:MAG: DUF4920 domain-containing protein [Flavobacterium sp. BFFFF2]
MKKLIALSCIALLSVQCQKKTAEVSNKKTDNIVAFGDKLTDTTAITTTELLTKMIALKEADTLNVQVKGLIESVCQKKGCWMRMQMGKESLFVRFKDYGFFVPKNAANMEAIIAGKAFISTETVDELKHYAKDAGKSQAAIDSIIKPEITYSFMAHGVQLKTTE